jgi:hypothetical protein
VTVLYQESQTPRFGLKKNFSLTVPRATRVKILKFMLNFKIFSITLVHYMLLLLHPCLWVHVYLYKGETEVRQFSTAIFEAPDETISIETCNAPAIGKNSLKF